MNNKQPCLTRNLLLVTMFGMFLSCCCKKKKKHKKASLLSPEEEKLHKSSFPIPVSPSEIVFTSSSPIFTLHSSTLQTSVGSSEDFYFYQVNSSSGLVCQANCCLVVWCLIRKLGQQQLLWSSMGTEAFFQHQMVWTSGLDINIAQIQRKTNTANKYVHMILFCLQM